MSFSAPVGKASPQEVHVYFAAHLLGIGGDEVVHLCKTGALRARCNRHGTWWIDEVFLVRWHAANPNYGAEDKPLAASKSAGDEERRALPCPPGMCEGHWQRRGRAVPAIRANLCQRCYSGRALPVKPEPDANSD